MFYLSGVLLWRALVRREEYMGDVCTTQNGEKNWFSLIKTGISSTMEEFSLIIKSRSVPELIDFSSRHLNEVQDFLK